MLFNLWKPGNSFGSESLLCDFSSKVHHFRLEHAPFYTWILLEKQIPFYVKIILNIIHPK